MSPREWDAATYDEVALPHAGWATVVLDRLELGGDETALDAGCGSGKVTGQLLARLRGGRVVAVDGSARMLGEARRSLAGHLDRLELVHAELTEPLPLTAPVGAGRRRSLLGHLPLDRRGIRLRCPTPSVGCGP